MHMSQVNVDKQHNVCSTVGQNVNIGNTLINSINKPMHSKYYTIYFVYKRLIPFAQNKLEKNVPTLKSQNSHYQQLIKIKLGTYFA